MKMSAFSLNILLLVAIALALIGCRCRHPENILSLKSSLRLPEDQITPATQKAEAGDRDAAFKLYEHYEYIDYNRPIAFKWLIRAAKGGHAVAQYNLGREYSGVFHSDRKDLQEAKFWLRKAAENGVKEATTQLEQLELKQE